VSPKDGKEAVAKATEGLPNIALLDISMPGLTGWEVAARLRLLRPEMKIMMVSANAHDFQAVYQEGSVHDAFLIKPFTIQSLLESVQLLSGRNGSMRRLRGRQTKRHSRSCRQRCRPRRAIMLNSLSILAKSATCMAFTPSWRNWKRKMLPISR